jgi:hypothetical protein
MNKQAILILVFSVVALSLAQVALTRHILLFTQTSQTGPQTRVNAHGVCVSLGNPVRPFLSGRSGSHIICHVWLIETVLVPRRWFQLQELTFGSLGLLKDLYQYFVENYAKNYDV